MTAPNMSLTFPASSVAPPTPPSTTDYTARLALALSSPGLTNALNHHLPSTVPVLYFNLTLYFQNMQGIIFVVDPNDWEHVSEAQKELQQMLNEDELPGAFLLVFAKIQGMTIIIL